VSYTDYAYFPRQSLSGLLRSTGVSQFLYVSSAGLYERSDEVPLVEGDAEKASAGHVGVEALLKSQKAPASIFRPIYILGERSAKPIYAEYFFDRLTRGRPIPLPESGDQFASLTSATDVASMIACAVGNPKAHGETFNMASPRYVTLNGLARLAAKAAGTGEPKVVHYDPAKAGDAAKGFPFRNQHFIITPGKAQRLLGWQSQGDVEEMLAAAYAEYCELGRDKTEIDWSKDDAIISNAALD